MPKDLGITDETWRRGAPRYYPIHDVDAGLRAAFADERAQERLRVASDLLACQPGLLGGCVRSVGTTTEVRLSPLARDYVSAALLVADHLLTANSLFRSAEEAGRPETCEACACGE